MTPRQRVLLVEDNAADVEFMLESLHGLGLVHDVAVARDGVEALRALGLEPVGGEPPAADRLPRLVILDVKLPRLDGLEVLARIKRHPATREIPVVMFTSSNLRRDVALGYHNGANSYVQKPVEFARFREVVRQLGQYWLSLNEPPPIEPGTGGDA
ncbi:MAG: response regulator [Gemmatimonadota bacterium]|nr:response regulator [Gemmatimonadota bacterium]HEU4990256.1 response regulator [Gemmatimonadaceae bacterium]